MAGSDQKAAIPNEEETLPLIRLIWGECSPSYHICHIAQLNTAVLSAGRCIQTFVWDRLCWNPRVSFLLKPLSCHSIDQSLWGEGGKKKTFYRDLSSKMWKGGMFMRKERNTCLWMRITYTEKSDKMSSPLKTNLGNWLPQNSGSPNPFSTLKGSLCNS